MDREKHIATLGQMVMQRLQEARTKIIAAHKGAGQMASGRTAASIKPEVNVGADSLEAILWGRRFFQGLETGRRGGKVPSGFYYMLKQWSIDKGISFAKESERSSFAYLLARKIAREGTALHRQGGRADIYTPEIRSVMSDLDKMVTWFMEQEMQSIKLNDIRSN